MLLYKKSYRRCFSFLVILITLFKLVSNYNLGSSLNKCKIHVRAGVNMKLYVSMNIFSQPKMLVLIIQLISKRVKVPSEIRLKLTDHVMSFQEFKAKDKTKDLGTGVLKQSHRFNYGGFALQYQY